MEEQESGRRVGRRWRVSRLCERKKAAGMLGFKVVLEVIDACCTGAARGGGIALLLDDRQRPLC